jgi:hypothetical protein
VPETNSEFGPFQIKDCALVAIATGQRAQNLKELRDVLRTIHPGAIYYHFWGRLLRPRFDDPEYNNDFAVWVKYELNDDKLAERLAVIDPTSFPTLEDLRRELVDVIEERLDELDWINWARHDRQLSLVRSQIVVFDTKQRIEYAEQLADVVPRLSVSSIFYHVIDARRRSLGRVDDFRAWLAGFNGQYEDLCSTLAGMDPYFVTLHGLRLRLANLFASHFHGERS